MSTRRDHSCGGRGEQGGVAGWEVSCGRMGGGGSSKDRVTHATYQLHQRTNQSEQRADKAASLHRHHYTRASPAASAAGAGRSGQGSAPCTAAPGRTAPQCSPPPGPHPLGWQARPGAPGRHVGGGRKQRARMIRRVVQQAHGERGMLCLEVHPMIPALQPTSIHRTHRVLVSVPLRCLPPRLTQGPRTYAPQPLPTRCCCSWGAPPGRRPRRRLAALPARPPWAIGEWP